MFMDEKDPQFVTVEQCLKTHKVVEVDLAIIKTKLDQQENILKAGISLIAIVVTTVSILVNVFL